MVGCENSIYPEQGFNISITNESELKVDSIKGFYLLDSIETSFAFDSDDLIVSYYSATDSTKAGQKIILDFSIPSVRPSDLTMVYQCYMDGIPFLTKNITIATNSNIIHSEYQFDSLAAVPLKNYRTQILSTQTGDSTLLDSLIIDHLLSDSLLQAESSYLYGLYVSTDRFDTISFTQSVVDTITGRGESDISTHFNSKFLVAIESVLAEYPLVSEPTDIPESTVSSSVTFSSSVSSSSLLSSSQSINSESSQESIVSSSSSVEIISSSSSQSSTLSSVAVPLSSSIIVSSSEVSSSSIIISSSSKALSSSSSASTFIDSRNGQEYTMVKIGTQVWMSKNLNFDSGMGSYCYDDDPTQCATYGRLYTWETAMNGGLPTDAVPSNVQGVCPDGWHLPSDAEMEVLAMYVVMQTGKAGKSDDDWLEIGAYLKAKVGWSGDLSNTDQFGFNGVPAGYRNDAGEYKFKGQVGYLLSATETQDGTYAIVRYTAAEQSYYMRSDVSKALAWPVRCIQGAGVNENISSSEANSSSAEYTWETMTDVRDGQVYKISTIGVQTWMSENLNYEAPANSWCFGEIDSNCISYGRLYTWSSVMNGEPSSALNPSDIQGICPDSWHVPSDMEWEELVSFVATSTGAMSYLEDDWQSVAPYLKASNGWDLPNEGTNDFGFSILSAGYRLANGTSYDLGGHTYFWTSTETSSDNAYLRGLTTRDVVARNTLDKARAYSVRCVRND